MIQWNLGTSRGYRVLTPVAVVFLLMTLLVLSPTGYARAAAYSCDEMGLNMALMTGGTATFTCGAATTVTVSATKTVNTSTTLDGGGLLTISGGNARRVFTVSNGVTFGVTNLTITGGNSTNGGGISSIGGTVNVTNSTLRGNTATSGVSGGGGIYNGGRVNVTNSTFSGNSATNDGGAIFSNTGTVNVTNSTFSGNTATANGAGIHNNLNGTVRVTNSTLSGNTANASGGGIYNTNGTVSLTNSTLAGNTAITSGGGIRNLKTLNVTNSIVAGNTAPSGGDIEGTYTDGAGNVVGGTPLLAALGSYGGSTQTRPPLPGSPAIDHAPATCPVTDPITMAALSTDQRGVSRPQGNACDSGAVESRAFTFSAPTGSGQSAVITKAFATPLGLTVTGMGGDPTDGGQVIFTITASAGAGATFGAATGCAVTMSNTVATCTITAGTATSPVLTANGTAGSYTASASATGVAAGTMYTLTNTLPTVSIAGATQNEGNSGTTTFTFPVALTPTVGVDVTVRYNTSDGSATVADTDYTAVVNGSVTIPMNTASANAVVQIVGDTKNEANETFTVTLSAPTNATLGTASATGTITNDDAAPSVSISGPAMAITEGNSGTTPAAFTVTLSAISGQTVTVRYDTSDGTATTGDNDYTAAINGTVTFMPGDTSKTITVLVNGDTKAELDETFSVVLSTPTNATLGTATAPATIANDDTASVTAITKRDADPTNAGSVRFTVTFSDPVSGVSAGNFMLVASSGITGATITSVAPTMGMAPTASYTVTVSTGTGTGMLGLNFTSGTGISPTTGGMATGPSYMVRPAPTAVGDTYGATANGTLTVSAAMGLLANDTSSVIGDTLTATNATMPMHGSATVSSDGSFTYTPTMNYVGPDSFTYTATSAANVNSTPVTVRITVTGIAPMASADSYSVMANSTLTVNAAQGVLANDTQGVPAATASKASDPTHGTVTVNSDGGFTYTPTMNYVGPDSFTYTATNSAGMSTGTVNLTVNGVAPIAMGDSYTATANTMLTVDTANGVLKNDNRGVPAATVTGSTMPAHGSVIVNSDGSFTYTPAMNYVGGDSFTYTATNSTGMATGTATLIVNGIAPLTTNDSYSATANGVLTVVAMNGVLKNDTGVPIPTAAKASDPLHGTVTVNSDGSFVYTPTPGYVGPDSFTYTASNGVMPNATGTVSITVGGSAPMTTTDNYRVVTGTALTVDAASGVLANDTRGVPAATASKASDPAHGAVTLAPDGSFTYTPTSGYTGADAFTYTATNSTGASTGTVNLTVDAATLVTLTLVAPTGSGSHNGGSAAQPQLVAGASLTLMLTGSYNNGAMGQAVPGASFASSDPSKATVDANGRVTALAPGTVLITATSMGRMTGITLVVTAPGTGGLMPNPAPMARPNEGTSPAAPVLPAPPTRVAAPGGIGPQGNGEATPTPRPAPPVR